MTAEALERVLEIGETELVLVAYVQQVIKGAESLKDQQLRTAILTGQESPVIIEQE